MKKSADQLAEWQKDHWRAVALSDLIMTAYTETEENERLAELRKIKAKWGHTLVTGYDPNAVRTGQLEPTKKLSANKRRVAEEYLPTSGSVGTGSASKAAGRLAGSPHGKQALLVSRESSSSRTRTPRT